MSKGLDTPTEQGESFPDDLLPTEPSPEVDHHPLAVLRRQRSEWWHRHLDYAERRRVLSDLAVHWQPK